MSKERAVSVAFRDVSALSRALELLKEMCCLYKTGAQSPAARRDFVTFSPAAQREHHNIAAHVARTEQFQSGSEAKKIIYN